jgi:hypothetical protein
MGVSYDKFPSTYAAPALDHYRLLRRNVLVWLAGGEKGEYDGLLGRTTLNEKFYDGRSYCDTLSWAAAEFQILVRSLEWGGIYIWFLW